MIIRLTCVAQVAVDLVRPGQGLLLAGLGEVVDDQLDREPARDLARGVPAHAVGDDREALVSPGSEIESSLWSRLRPMLVAPANRTRIPSSGNDVLIRGRF